MTTPPPQLPSFRSTKAYRLVSRLQAFLRPMAVTPICYCYRWTTTTTIDHGLQVFAGRDWETAMTAMTHCSPPMSTMAPHQAAAALVATASAPAT